MFHRMFPLGQLACNASLIGDEVTREALIVDPGEAPESLIAAIDEGGWNVREILFTHTHIDHVAGAPEVLARVGAPVAMHRADLPVYDSLSEQAAWVGMPAPERVTISRWLEEGDEIACGSLRLQTLFTPGHAPGHVSFYCREEGILISGDVLFRGSIGRTDLPGGDYDELMRSIREKLMTLPDETTVIPGHGAATTIGLERRTNPFLVG